MAVRTNRLALHRAVPQGTHTTVYSTPADRTAVVKRFGFVNRAAAAREVRLCVRSGGFIHDVWATSVAVQRLAGQEFTWLVLEPGDDLVVWSDSTPANDLLHFSASGAVLAGAPVE